MTGIRDAGGGSCEVATADGATHRAPRVVIATDAWTKDLAGSDRRRR